MCMDERLMYNRSLQHLDILPVGKQNKNKTVLDPFQGTALGKHVKKGARSPLVSPHQRAGQAGEGIQNLPLTNSPDDRANKIPMK